MTTRRDRQNLRYLDACCVQHPAGTLEGLDVCGQDAERLGEIVGVLVEPARRRVRYFVVERPAILRRKRYLLPADCLATLQSDDGTIYMEVDDQATERFDVASVQRFSDDDVVDAVFASTAA